MMPAFSWASCTLTLLSATGLASVVVTEYWYIFGEEKEEITRKAKKVVSRGTERKISTTRVTSSVIFLKSRSSLFA